MTFQILGWNARSAVVGLMYEKVSSTLFSPAKGAMIYSATKLVYKLKICLEVDVTQCSIIARKLCPCNERMTTVAFFNRMEKRSYNSLCLFSNLHKIRNVGWWYRT